MSLFLTILLSAATGSIITAVSSICSAYVQRRADERRQIRELAVRVAVENWRFSYDAAKAAPVVGQKIAPLGVFLIHAMCLVRALDGSVRTPEEVSRLMREGSRFADAAAKEVS
jgi:hypothetical protein